jgi:hypothetical protein
MASACIAGIDIFGAVAERVRKLAITLPGQRHHLLGVVVWIEAIEELRGRGAARPAPPLIIEEAVRLRRLAQRIIEAVAKPHRECGS